MKNCCALCSFFIALFIITGSLQAQTQAVNTKTTTIKNCDPSKCDVTKCTPEQLAACKAACKKTCNKSSFGLATLTSNKAENTTKKTSCQPAQCTAKQKAACNKVKSVSTTKKSQLAEVDATTATKEME